MYDNNLTKRYYIIPYYIGKWKTVSKCATKITCASVYKNVDEDGLSTPPRIKRSVSMTIPSFIGNMFDNYDRQSKYELGVSIPKTLEFSGLGLTHNCNIYSADREQFIWNMHTITKKKPELQTLQQYLANPN